MNRPRLSCLWLLLAALSLTAPPALAGPAGDAVFRTGVMETLAEGMAGPTYRHSRSAGTSAPGAPPLGEDRTVTVMRGGGDSLVIAMNAPPSADTGPKRIDGFPVDGGNPVLMLFLESVTRNIAGLTGGSPFYIRNRLRDALRGGDLAGDPATGPATATFRPFAGDPNAARMGDLAEMVVTIEMDPALPGYFRRLAATTVPGGYTETVALEPAP